jgi:hypothetical protein
MVRISVRISLSMGGALFTQGEKEQSYYGEALWDILQYYNIICYHKFHDLIENLLKAALSNLTPRWLLRHGERDEIDSCVDVAS